MINKWKLQFIAALTVASIEFILASVGYSLLGYMPMIPYTLGMLWSIWAFIFLYKWQKSAA